MQQFTFHPLLIVCLSGFITFCSGQCKDKPISPHAVLHLEGIYPPFSLGQWLIFVCELGYDAQGAQPRAKCTRDSRGRFIWEYFGGTCQPQCTDFPTAPHANIIALNGRKPPFTLEDKVGFHCELGYGSLQYIEASCKLVDGKAKWVLPEFECELVDCGPPPDVEEATSTGDEFYTHMSNITYYCNVGYEIHGDSTLTCSEIGQWEPKHPPYCRIVVCPPLSFPKHGYVHDYGHNYNTIAKYVCDTGYHLIGNLHRTCQANKMWTGSEPICVATVCYDPGPLDNGKVYKTKDEFQEGDTIIYVCNEGGTTYSAKCQKNGEWSERPPICKGGTGTQSTMTTSTAMSTTASTLAPKNTTASDQFEEPNNSRIGDAYIVAIAVSISLLMVISIAIIALLCYRKKRTGFRKKALTSDAVYLGELKKLEKARNRF